MAALVAWGGAKITVATAKTDGLPQTVSKCHGQHDGQTWRAQGSEIIGIPQEKVQCKEIRFYQLPLRDQFAVCTVCSLRRCTSAKSVLLNGGVTLRWL